MTLSFHREEKKKETVSKKKEKKKKKTKSRKNKKASIGKKKTEFQVLLDATARTSFSRLGPRTDSKKKHLTVLIILISYSS